tara:strand:+ start:61150 stop:62010 length:861 start_codon:yes stop_codon:yes gene_type:complete
MTEEENKIAAVQKALGEPVFVGFSEETLKVRRNMLAFTFITLSYALSGASIESFSPLGITFNDFDLNHINTVFFFLVAYHLVHFLWQSIDALLEWHIRITGTRLAFLTGSKFTDSNADYPDDPRQSSLMTWWQIESGRYTSVEEAINTLEQAANNLDMEKVQREAENDINLQNVTGYLARVPEETSKIKASLDNLERALNSDRIPASLDRFEKWFRLFSWSQLSRWFVLEWGGPIVLALWALYLINPWTGEASTGNFIETTCTTPDRIEDKQENHLKCITIKKKVS